VKRIGWVNVVLVILVFGVMAPQYGLIQGLVLAGLVLVILVGYDRLARRFLAARREHDKDPDRFR
jgi:multisubunit Na+/H+ antiporter MnhB subunit